MPSESKLNNTLTSAQFSISEFFVPDKPDPNDKGDGILLM